MNSQFAKYGLTPWGAAPNHRHMEWYRRGKTAFLHFTVNTFTDREWGDGTESPADFAPTAASPLPLSPPSTMTASACGTPLTRSTVSATVL